MSSLTTSPTGLRPPILVTGCFRSGTTWVGRTLTRSPELGWVAEPFHVRHRRGVFASPTPLLYTYVCDENEADYADNLGATIAGRYRWGPAFGGIERPVDVGIVAKDAVRFAGRRLRRQRAVLKDPIALFSAPWIHRRFDADVIVMVRHPAAIMASLDRLGWRFNFNHLLQQPLLMRDLLSPWADEIAAMAADEHASLVAQTALVWRLMYGTVAQWRDDHPDWRVVRHEDLSRSPVAGFAQLFDAVGVPMTPEITGYIEERTSAANPVSAPTGQAHALRRDSRANVHAWAERLDAADVAELRTLTDDVASVFYGPEDW